MRTPMKHLAGRRLVSTFLVAAGLLCATNKGPDGGNYTATDSTVFSFIDPAGGGSAPSVLAGTDDGGALLTLPFAIQFYGQSYTMLCVSSNGIAYFVSSSSTFCGSPAQTADFANTDLSSTVVPGDLPAIAPFWMDLTFASAGAGAVYYQTAGTAPNRQFIIEWYNAFPAGTVSPVTFEAILNEGSNNVLFQYRTVNLGSGNAASNGGTATVGIRNSGGNTNGKAIEWSFDSAVLSNNYAILFTAPSSTNTSVNTITTSPSGITVTVDSTPMSTPAVVYWAPNSTHALSVASSPTNGTNAKTAFSSWSTGATTSSINVTAGAAGTTYTATFNTQYELTTTASPSNEGSVSGNGTFVTANNSITVTATPTSPYVFKYFTGDLSGTNKSQSLLMNGPKNVTAVFGVPYACSVSNGSTTTITDVQGLVNEALGKAAPNNDVNSDGKINVTDVQIVVNALLFSNCTTN
ncbi:MAG TPA: hypothetical protein VMB03_17325 [Bryobacteraceae bacterium]|nr:hypothetical protein [Bryobacteraceae bacterium]